MALTIEERRILISKESNALKVLSRELAESKDAFLKLKFSGEASAKALQDAGAKVTRLGTELNKARTEVNNLANANKKLSASGLADFGAKLTVVGAGLGIVVSKFSQFVQQAADLGSQLTVLRDAFQGSENDLELFRIATARTVSDANLLKLSNQARDLGIGLNQQARLFSLAEDAGDKYGGSVEENMQRVVLAIAKNGRGLEQLGVTTVEYKKIMSELVEAGNLNVDTMTEEERIAIGFEAIMKITGGTLDDVKNKTQDVRDKMESMKATQDNLTAAFGQGMNVTLEKTFDIMSDLVKGFNDATGSTLTMKDAVRGLGEAVTTGLISPLLGLKNLLSEIASSPGFQIFKLGVTGFGGGTSNRNPFNSAFPQGRNAERPGRLGEEAGQALAPDISAIREELLSTLSQFSQNLVNTADVFGIKSDSTLLKIVERFSDILSLVENTFSLISNISSGIGLFKSLLGIIPGVGATGAIGATAGGSIPVVNPSTANLGGGNTYLKLDLNTMQVVKDGLPNYQDYKGAIRV